MELFTKVPVAGGGPWYEQGMEHILHYFDSSQYHLGLLPGSWAMATKMGSDPQTHGVPLVLHGYGGKSNRKLAGHPASYYFLSTSALFP